MVRRLWAERDKAIRLRLLTDMDDSCISLSVSCTYCTVIQSMSFHNVIHLTYCNWLWNVTFSMIQLKEPVHSKMNTRNYSSSCQFKPLRLSIIKDVSHYVHSAFFYTIKRDDRAYKISDYSILKFSISLCEEHTNVVCRLLTDQNVPGLDTVCVKCYYMWESWGM